MVEEGGEESRDFMTQKTYYVDSCIWLNLFKKEGDTTKGTPYWKLAKDFLEMIKTKPEELIN